MATRLYPVTENPRNLELLMGMPEGSHEIYTEIRNRYRDNESSFERYQAEQDEYEKHGLGDYAHFIMYGWGRIPYGRGFDEDRGIYDEDMVILHSPANVPCQRLGRERFKELCEGFACC